MISASEARRAVWVVDDSHLDGERAARALANDYNVTTFSEGSAALERFASGVAPDALVLDWMMPGISGLEVCQFLRTRGGASERVGILMLTAARETENVVAGLRAGANDFLVKPFSDEELRERVGAIMRTRLSLERAEQAEARVTELLRSAPDPLLAFDDAGFLTFASEEAAELLGGSREKLQGRAAGELLPTLAHYLQPALSPNVAMRLPDVPLGSRVYAPTLRLMPTDGGTLRMVALRDVTESRREEVRRMDFYSIVAHDMRSPLSALALRNTLLEKGRYGLLPPAALAELRKNDTTMKTLIRLINDFLDFARLEGAGLKLEREETFLADLVRATVDDLRPLVDARELQIQIHAPEVPVSVRGDRYRLMQVVANLLSNAIKFTPPRGSIVVTVRPESDRVEVAVRDTGPGIPAAALPTLFDRFTRVDASPTRPSGTGLGLMIAKQIVEAHGGRIWVTTKEGNGSEFCFSVPRPTI